MPRVAEPQRRQQVQRRRLRPAVVRGDAHQQVVVVRLRVLDLHVEVAVVVEHAGVEQLVLEVAEAALAVRPQQVVVRVRRLRVLVDALHVRVRRRAVDVEPVLLDVLAVVALGVRQPEHPLLEDRVGAVPQREREAQPLLVVGHAGDPVLAPAVGARARVVVREVAPRVAAAAVVLADRPPLALAQVWAPGLPRRRAGARRLQPIVLWRAHRARVWPDARECAMMAPPSGGRPLWARNTEASSARARRSFPTRPRRSAWAASATARRSFPTPPAKEHVGRFSEGEEEDPDSPEDERPGSFGDHDE